MGSILVTDASGNVVGYVAQYALSSSSSWKPSAKLMHSI